MDGERFDAWTRRWSANFPRRAALRLLAGAGASGLAARHDAEATACVPAGQRCGRRQRCCADATCEGGRCRCRTGAVACFAGKWRTGPDPYDVAVGPGGRVYVAEFWRHRILKFDADGAARTTWGHFGSDPGEFKGPRSVAVGPDGTVYVVETREQRLRTFTADGGTLLDEWALGGYGEPRRLAVGPGGSVYVATWSEVILFAADGSFQARFYEVGYDPEGVAVAMDGSVCVCTSDDDDSRLLRFAADLTLLGEAGGFGRGNGRLRFPNGVAVAPDGSVFVADGRNDRIQRFLPA